MLTFQWRRVTGETPASQSTIEDVVGGSVADTNPELKIRNLMDDPRVRALLVTASSHDDASDDNVVTALPVRAPGTSMSDALREGIADRPAA